LNKKNGIGAENGRTITSRGISFPWVIVILSTALLMVVSMYNYTYGVFFKPIADEFGWSRAVVSGGYSVRCLVAAVSVVPMGYWADRYGPRRVLLPSLIFIGICMMAMAKVTAIWQLYLIQGVGFGISTSGPFACITSTVAKWHDTKRGLALGIAAAGIGLSSIIFPPMATYLIQAVNWQFAIFILGVIILVVGIPASFFMKDPPNEKGEQPKDIPQGIVGAWSALPRFVKNRTFFAIVIIFFLTNCVGYLLLNHFVNYATDIGLTALAAAGMMSIMGVASTIGRLGLGTFSDKIGAKKDAAICCLLIGLSFILLITKSTALMWVAVMIFGVGFGGTVPLAPAIMGERVNNQQLSTATAAASMGMFVGGAVGPWAGGIIFDRTGGYLWALLLGVGISIAAFIIVLCLPPIKTRLKSI